MSKEIMSNLYGYIKPISNSSRYNINTLWSQSAIMFSCVEPPTKVNSRISVGIEKFTRKEFSAGDITLKLSDWIDGFEYLYTYADYSGIGGTKTAPTIYGSAVINSTQIQPNGTVFEKQNVGANCTQYDIGGFGIPLVPEPSFGKILTLPYNLDKLRGVSFDPNSAWFRAIGLQIPVRTIIEGYNPITILPNLNSSESSFFTQFSEFFSNRSPNFTPTVWTPLWPDIKKLRSIYPEFEIDVSWEINMPDAARITAESIVQRTLSTQRYPMVVIHSSGYGKVVLFNPITRKSGDRQLFSYTLSSKTIPIENTGGPSPDVFVKPEFYNTMVYKNTLDRLTFTSLISFPLTQAPFYDSASGLYYDCTTTLRITVRIPQNSTPPEHQKDSRFVLSSLQSLNSLAESDGVTIGEMPNLKPGDILCVYYIGNCGSLLTRSSSSYQNDLRGIALIPTRLSIDNTLPRIFLEKPNGNMPATTRIEGEYLGCTTPAFAVYKFSNVTQEIFEDYEIVCYLRSTISNIEDKSKQIGAQFAFVNV